jgi:pyridoxamine 5'-phosphate oxidase
MPDNSESNRDINNSPLFDDPFAWFDAWFAQAEATGMTDPNAMAIATSDADGQPTVRIVLLKEWDTRGYVFYTNLLSTKGRALADNPKIGANFFWRDMGRQIRIEGTTERVSDEQADAYFQSRPRGSRIGAWASDQSQPLESRETLMKRTDLIAEKYDGELVPRPPHWSGTRIVPARFEFWEAGEFRLHNRWEFVRTTDGWVVNRLNP